MSKELFEKTKELIVYVSTIDKIDMEKFSEKIDELRKLRDIPSKNDEDKIYKMMSFFLLKGFGEGMLKRIEDTEYQEFFRKLDNGEI